MTGNQSPHLQLLQSNDQNLGGHVITFYDLSIQLPQAKVLGEARFTLEAHVHDLATVVRMDATHLTLCLVQKFWS